MAKIQRNKIWWNLDVVYKSPTVLGDIKMAATAIELVLYPSDDSYKPTQYVFKHKKTDIAHIYVSLFPACCGIKVLNTAYFYGAAALTPSGVEQCVDLLLSTIRKNTKSGCVMFADIEQRTSGGRELVTRDIMRYLESHKDKYPILGKFNFLNPNSGNDVQVLSVDITNFTK